MLRRQRRVTDRSVHLRSIDVSAVDLGLRKCRRSLGRSLLCSVHQVPALAANEVADPEQAGPPALVIGLLAGQVRGLQLSALLTLHLLQKVDHTLQNLCLFNLWILQVLHGIK